MKPVPNSQQTFLFRARRSQRRPRGIHTGAWRTTVRGIVKSERQANSRIGGTVVVPVGPRALQVRGE